jgi:hypothetical protein
MTVAKRRKQAFFRGEQLSVSICIVLKLKQYRIFTTILLGFAVKNNIFQKNEIET